MKKQYARYATLLVLLLVITAPVVADELKAFYEEQKAEIVKTFKAPELGTEMSLRLLTGQTRTGILMKLAQNDVSLMTDAGMVQYKKNNLHDSSRALLFADDFAHAKAIELTRERKQQMHLQNIKDEMAQVHEGSITVVSKLDKSSDKEVERDERENRDGETTQIITTTKTKTETQNLTITVANNATHQDTFTLEWYFFSAPPDSPRESVHDKGSRNVTVDARKREKITITSEPCIFEEETINRESTYGSSPDPRVTTSGKVSRGYVVLLKYGDTVLDQKASSGKYLTDEWLGKLR